MLLRSLRWHLFLQGLWEQCQLLKRASVFARCHPLVDPEPFVALCERTLCTCTQGLRCPCTALLEYARACAHQGMVLYGWTEHSECRKLLPTSLAGKAAQGLGKSGICPGVSHRNLSVPQSYAFTTPQPARAYRATSFWIQFLYSLCPLSPGSQRESVPLKSVMRLKRPCQGLQAISPASVLTLCLPQKLHPLDSNTFPVCGHISAVWWLQLIPVLTACQRAGSWPNCPGWGWQSR